MKIKKSLCPWCAQDELEIAKVVLVDREAVVEFEPGFHSNVDGYSAVCGACDLSLYIHRHDIFAAIKIVNAAQEDMQSTLRAAQEIQKNSAI